MTQKDFIGKKHHELLTWLRDSWIPAGPPVCFLEGFPGVGKSNLARKLAVESPVTAVSLEIPDSSTVSADDLLLNLAQAWSEAGNSELAEAIAAGKDPLLTLVRLLQNPVLIVMDEFQNAMTGEQAKLSGPLANLFQRLARNPQAKGRILLLTNRLVERERWSEGFEKKDLEGLDADDGAAFLSQILTESGREDEVSSKDRPSVVHWLGGNPRALNLLVASLKYSPLEELMGVNPDTWEYSDLSVSPDLIQEIEHQMLERILGKLANDFQNGLRQLSVFRKPFKKEALEVLFPQQEKLDRFKAELINQFLMEQHSGRYSLHSIVREIGLQKLLDKPTELKKAHAQVARHYTRYFYGTQLTKQLGTLGGYFTEARYHLVQAGEQKELTQIARYFFAHLSASFNFVTPIPKDQEALQERIAVLAAVLESPGPIGLECHLARLYEARRQKGDLDKAIQHIRRAVGSKASVDVWQLAGKLLNQNNQRDEAIRLLRTGINNAPSAELYGLCAELLAQNNQLDEAIELLREGIERVPFDKGAPMLYAFCGNLLLQDGQRGEAIKLLKSGLDKLPDGLVNVQLSIAYVELLNKDGQRNEAIALLRKVIKIAPLAPLYQSCAEMLAQNNQSVEAIELLREGIGKIPTVQTLFSLYHSCAELLCLNGQWKDAVTLLWEGVEKVPVQQGGITLVQALSSYEAAVGNLTGLRNLVDKSGTAKDIVIYFIHQHNQDWESAAYAAENSSYPTIIHSAFCWLSKNEPEKAKLLLQRSVTSRYEKGTVNCWLMAFTQHQSGDLDAARYYLSLFLGEDWTGPATGIRPTLLRLWDEADMPWGRGDLALYFPILPATFTGLPHAVRRQVYAPPVLPAHLKTIPASSAQPITIEPNPAAQMLQDKRVRGAFDVFLCHNSADKSVVKKIGEHLQQFGLLPWLDEWELQPGRSWQRSLEAQINSIKSVAVFVGPDGIGPWQHNELDAFLRQFVKRDIPVIPVLLPECGETPTLPVFLESFTWVDFRKEIPNPYQQLVWGITGQKPETLPAGTLSQPAEQLSNASLIEEVRAAVREEITHAREALMQQSDDHLRTVLQHLTDAQVTIVQTLSQGIQEKRFSETEMAEMLDAIREIRDHASGNPDLAADLKKLPDIFEDTKLAVAHKLKLSLPIIPLLLSYEGEFNLNSGTNISKLVKNMLTKVRGG